ncbi:MAG TPA: DUF2637 domain-containing protein [Actinophytocola sp.]|uniref:DUF2637 domain-containing protein n=1 Tax=Actinophytocola sp. TaxID=1872138 RepID=UPI002DDD91AE|nr:DUF2637 domain-containing protein [Actinophytocola sp.]HEV2780213.1 DUF2637 domain-containing protein [Actinophytocola sp.]
MTETRTESTRPRSRDRELWLRRGCALIVAAVAAYGSYEHQRDFALHGGADPVGAALWPLSVDGLLFLATAGLLKSGQQASRRVRLAAWLSFLLGIAVSLAANIAAAPTLAWQSVLVAGWPPIALLLAAELLTHHPRPREQIETEPVTPEQEPDRETGTETEHAVTPNEVSKPDKPPAEQAMWQHFLREQTHGRTPTGAELDRVAGTNNYGRTVLRRWRQQGRIPPAEPSRRNGHRVPGPGGTRSAPRVHTG